VTFPFDPFNLAPRLAAGLPRGASAAVDAWLDATKWWTEPARELAQQGWDEADGRLLVELCQGLARGFTDRAMVLEVDGRTARAVLGSVRLTRRDGRFGARLDLRDVTWDARAVGAVSIHARSVELTAPPQTRLTASDVEMVGHASLDAVVGWLDQQLPDWSLEAARAGLLALRRPGRSRSFLVTAVVVDGEVTCELRGIRWRRLRLDVPAWLHLRRSIALPAAQGRISVVEARCRGDVVDFRAVVPTISRQLNLTQLRDAILGQSAIRLR
jgi:hypothetical protein